MMSVIYILLVQIQPYLTTKAIQSMLLHLNVTNGCMMILYLNPRSHLR